MGDYISYLSSSKETVGTYIYNNSSWGDMLTAYNGTAISYDEIGNPLNWRNISEMTWEGRELQAATVTAGPRAVYEYNSDGIRTKKTLASVVKYDYVLDGTKILSETVTHSSAGTSRTLYFLYDESGSVQGFIYNNQHYYFQKNLQGDVIRILNNYGTVVVEYTYDAWGNVLTITGSLASTVGSYNPFRYRGYYYDAETGFYYLQSRYYDPTVGRFLNADHPELIGASGTVYGNNLYAYCFNNPIAFSDSIGTWPEWMQEAGSRLKHTFTIMNRIALSPFKALTVEVGAGVGLGVNLGATAGGIPVEGGLCYSIRDTVSYDKGEFDLKNTTSAEAGIVIADVFDFSSEQGHSHSYTDDNCTCDFFDSSFGEKSNCPANTEFSSQDNSVGISFGMYLLLGAEFSVEFDFEAWGRELHSILHQKYEVN